MQEQTKRKYECSDAILLQEGNLNKNLLAAHLAAFTAEDETVDADYVAAYEQDLTEAEEADTDEEVEDILATKTQLVKDIQKAVAKKVQQVRYYVMQAFPDKKIEQKEFGLDRWDKVRNNQAETIVFLKAMHGAATRYQAKLTPKGFGPTRTASILTVRQLLEDANDDQEEYRSGRVKLTSLRIEEYNEVYDRITQINALAQIVFADDEAMARQFVFDPSGHGGGDEGQQYIGSIGAGETKTIATVTYVAGQSIKLKNTGSAELALSLNVAAGAPEGNPLDVPAGAEDSKTMAELNPDTSATIVQVKASEAGAYIVTVDG